MAKKKNWVLIIIASIFFIVVVGIGAVASVAYIMYRQFAPESQRATAASAEQQFNDISARYRNEKPYIEMQDDRPVVNRDQEKATPSTIEALHVLVWNPREARTFRINIPFWLVRVTGDRPIQLGDERSGFKVKRSLNVTARDI